MMFTVKAEYKGEIRKLVFDTNGFPTFQELCQKLSSVFSLSKSYYLKNLVFSSGNRSQMLIGMQVYNEQQYNSCVAPFTIRYYGDGILKLTIIDDERVHMSPTDYSTSTVPDTKRTRTSETYFADYNIDLTKPGLSESVSAGCVSAAPAARCEGDCVYHVQKSKEEIKKLLDTFLEDFNGILAWTFEDATPLVNEQAISHGSETTLRDNSLFPNVPGSFTQDQGFTLEGLSPSAGNVNDLIDLIDGLWCSRCGLRAVGSSFRCIKCIDYLLCTICFSEQRNVRFHQEQFTLSEEHNFLSNSTSAFEALGEHLADVGRDNPAVHMSYICNVCCQVIVGRRYRCLTCTDYDLCDDCFRISDVIASHDRDHDFYVFNHPQEGMIGTRTNLNSRGFHEDAHVREAGVLGTVHDASCNLCDSIIVGHRFKCLNCPDFDVCSSCFTIVPLQHPYHKFVRISSTVDLIEQKPAAQNKHSAICNECDQVIYGARFKCAHSSCPDFDLCENCEALPIPVHPETHPMLKFRYSSSVKFDKSHCRHLSPSELLDGIEKGKGKLKIEATVQVPDTNNSEMNEINGANKVMLEIRKHSPSAMHNTVEKSSSKSQEFFSRANTPIELSSTPVAAYPSLNYSNNLASKSYHSDTNIMQDSHVSPCVTKHLSFLTKSPVLSMSNSYAGFGAAFIEDQNIIEQIIPSGMDFFKRWQMQNDGDLPWPKTTNLVFVAGDRMANEKELTNEYHVGTVLPGNIVDIVVKNFKAPERPGKYIGYWRLRTGSILFGQSVWCEITVPEILSESVSYGSLPSSSSAIMSNTSLIKEFSVDFEDQDSGGLIDPQSLVSDNLYKDVDRQLVSLHVTSDKASAVSDILSNISDSNDSNPSWEDFLLDADQGSDHEDADFVVLYDDNISEDEAQVYR